MKKTQSQTTYNKLASNYRQISREKKDYLSSIDSLIVSILNKTDSIVDLGSGDGVRIAKLAKKLQAKKVVLVDNSNKMLKLSEKIPRVKVVKNSIVNFQPGNRFDAVTCLWNVLGHVEPFSDIRKVFGNVDDNLLKKRGLLFLDVNNKYNASAYSAFLVIKNIAKDVLTPFFKEEYIRFCKKVLGEEIKMKVHFFNPYEIEGYLKGTKLRVVRKFYVNYNNGSLEKVFWRGQVFYVIEKI